MAIVIMYVVITEHHLSFLGFLTIDSHAKLCLNAPWPSGQTQIEVLTHKNTNHAHTKKRNKASNKTNYNGNKTFA